MKKIPMNKILSILLALCMVLTLLPQNSLTAFAATREATDFTTLQNAITSASDGDTIEIKAPIVLTATLTISKSLTFTASDSYTLTRGSGFTHGSMFNINGSGKTVTFENITIDGGGVEADAAGIAVNAGEFIFNDGAVLQKCNNIGYSPGGGVYVGSGTFIMNGGSITNNSSNSGGGVYAMQSFTMTGGNITGNHSSYSGGGVYIGHGCQFEMTGGSITNNNTGYYGGGVEIGTNCNVRFSGDISIKDNQQSGGIANNLYLWSDNITLAGALASTAVIGVTKYNPPTSGNPVEVAVSDASYTGGITSNDAAKFVSDNASYKISYDSTNKKVMLEVRVAVDVTINETAQTVTYNGSPQAFATTGTPSTGFTISYQQGDSEVTPTKAGTYDVKITRAQDADYKAYSKTIPSGLTINKATPTINTPPTAASIISGAALSTSALTGGSASVPGTFSWSNGSTIPAAGTNSYSVTFTPSDTDNYNTITTNVAITVTTAQEASAPVQSGTGKAEGTVIKDQQQSDGAPAASVENSGAELKTSVLTPQEQEMVAQGENVRVILKVVDISASISAEEKQLIDKTLNLTNADTGIPALYVDLSLYKQVGDREQTRITETNGKISVSIEVPESLRNTDVEKTRSFYIIRIHENEAIRIDGTYDLTTHLFTFETDQFSTYALTYQDVNTATVDNDDNTTDQPALAQDFNPLRLTAKAEMYAQTLTYAKVSGADGYLIYGAKCGQKLKKVDDVDKTITSYTVKNLKLATYYKYQVKAYKMINGKRVILRTSKVVHSVTKSKLYANVTKLTSNTAAVKLSVGESKTVTCQVVLPEGKKQREHTAVIRYESSNQAIATVSSKGKITAKAKGICYVYAYAQNGVYKKITVTVE
jgi:hypothetical protein